MRTPTAPGVRFQSAMTSATDGLAGSTGLTRANPGGMALVHLERIAGVVAVDRERRNQDCAVDADGVHRGDHLVTRDLARSRQYGIPRPARGRSTGDTCRNPTTYLNATLACSRVAAMIVTSPTS